MKIFITGISGFLGERLAEHLLPRHEVAGCCNTTIPLVDCEHRRFDLAEGPALLLDTLEGTLPDCVIHTAAVSRPNRFARDPLRCRRVNVEATEALARWCRERDRGLLFCSSDTVYPDAALRRAPRAGWTEEQALDPANEYGRSKAEAEALVRELLPAATLLRLSLLYGRAREDRNSFSEWLLKRYREGGPVSVFRDNRRRMLAVSALCGVIEGLLEHPAGGPLNVGGADYMSREEFARRLFDHLGLDPGRLEACDTAQAVLEVQVPLELPMDLGRLLALVPEGAGDPGSGIPEEYPLRPSGDGV